MRYCLVLFLSGIFLLAGCGRNPAGEPEVRRLYTSEELNSALALLTENPDDIPLNRTVWSYYTEKGQYAALITHAEPVFSRSYNVSGKEQLALTAGAFISQAYVFQEKFDSVAFYLDRIMPLAEGKYSDDFLDALTHNIAALYYLKTELDYSAALEHYEAACEIMERKGETINQSTLLCNIASIYVTLRDPAGFDYAQRAYDINHSGRDGVRSYTRVFSTILLAQMHYLKGDFNRALEYADEASSEVDSFPQFVSSLDLLYADIAADRGDYRRAEHYYRLALAGEKDTEPSVTTYLYLRFGTMLSRLARYTEAREMLRSGLETNSMEYRDELLLALSDVAVRQGREDEALEFYKEYHACMDSVSYMQRERAFRQNRILAKDNELQSKELDLLKANRRIILFVAALALILIIAVALLFVNRRQKRMYRRIVEVHQQLLSRVGDVREAGNKAEAGTQEKEDRELTLWRKLEELMASGKIYRHSDISLDRIAEMLGTNRAYVSRVINNYSGKSFYHYIHSRRIEEASRKLSDASEDVSLKTLASDLGYNSISSFYRAFIKEIGVPPSKYREVVLEIK